MANDKPDNFRISKPNLVDLDSGLDIWQVNESWDSIHLGIAVDYNCCVCKQPPKYYLIPKPTSGLPQPKPEDSMVCEHCLRTYFDKDLFGIKAIYPQDKS
ncbi:hypothetical protein D3C81_1811140 [compost metagenome]